MKKINYFAALSFITAIATATIGLLTQQAKATGKLKVSCDLENPVPTVIATFYNQESSQSTPILSFLPQYFSEEQAAESCQSTAQKLNGFYTQNKMNYLASDTIDQQPVVCAVERRGLSCDSYNSEILFSLARPTSPTKLLYDMLGSNFKGSQLPSSRTVSRIYTDLRPTWWRGLFNIR